MKRQANNSFVLGIFLVVVGFVLMFAGSMPSCAQGDIKQQGPVDTSHIDQQYLNALVNLVVEKLEPKLTASIVAQIKASMIDASTQNATDNTKVITDNADVQGTQIKDGGAQASGERSNAVTVDGEGGPLLAFVVVQTVAVAVVVVVAIRFRSKSSTNQDALVKLMEVIEARDGKVEDTDAVRKIKSDFNDLISVNPKTLSHVEKLLDEQVRLM